MILINETAVILSKDGRL